MIYPVDTAIQLLDNRVQGFIFKNNFKPSFSRPQTKEVLEMQKIPRREDADNTRCLPQNFAQTLFPVYPGYDGCLVRT